MVNSDLGAGNDGAKRIGTPAQDLSAKG
jgi:hypothetical protein